MSGLLITSGPFFACDKKRPLATQKETKIADGLFVELAFSDRYPAGHSLYEYPSRVDRVEIHPIVRLRPVKS